MRRDKIVGGGPRRSFSFTFTVPVVLCSNPTRPRASAAQRTQWMAYLSPGTNLETKNI